MRAEEREPLAAGREPDSAGEQWRRARAEVRVLRGTIASIAGEVRELARREGVLARAEIEENTSLAKQAGIWGAVAAVATLMVLPFLGLALMFALALFVPLWAAALITMLVFALVAGACGWLAMKRLGQFSALPRRTMQSLREDVRWAREQMKRNAP